ncbi:MAG: sigma-70 family RNA polymerase sigma factor [Anaerohalosphaeraceae bacterium]
MDKKDQVKPDEFLNLLMQKQMRIYAFILSVVRNFEDADDILQETVHTMWQKYEECRPIEDFVAWGIQVAYYKILEYRKKKDRTVHVDLNSGLFDQVMAASRTLDKEGEEVLEKLKRCLKQLSPRSRRFIELRYYQDLKPKQIAVLLGLSVVNVYKILSRIHSQLVQCVRLQA